MKVWQRLRRFWWERVCGMSPAEAADLMDGIDDGDRAVLSLRLLIRRERRRRLPTAEDLERLEAEFLADEGRQRAVIKKILADLPGRNAREKGEHIVKGYLARRN